MNRTTSSGPAGSGIGGRPPFTASQWEELEHQALIFKYLITGIPVPPELLLTIRRNYDSIAASFYSHPSLSYCSFYGKKVDPEPGRCRRTDGKKWRCSKDAYPDSKYCERHMHRGRSRSRKHVETSQPIPHSHSSSSTEKPVAPSSAPNSGGAGVAGGEGFRGLPFRSIAAAPVTASSSQVQIDPVSLSYGMPAAIGAPAKEFRYLHESKPELDKCSFYSEASRTLRTPSMHSSFDSSWCQMPSPIYSFPLSKEKDHSFLHSNYLQLQPTQDLGSVPFSSLHHNHERSLFRSEFSSLEPPGKSAQPLLPFFDEWPRTRDSWSDLEDERANQASFATTQLSISIPMVSSDFSTTTSLSQNDD